MRSPLHVVALRCRRGDLLKQSFSLLRLFVHSGLASGRKWQGCELESERKLTRLVLAEGGITLIAGRTCNGGRWCCMHLDWPQVVQSKSKLPLVEVYWMSLSTCKMLPAVCRPAFKASSTGPEGLHMKVWGLWMEPGRDSMSKLTLKHTEFRHGADSRLLASVPSERSSISRSFSCTDRPESIPGKGHGSPGRYSYFTETWKNHRCFDIIDRYKSRWYTPRMISRVNHLISYPAQKCMSNWNF